MDWILCNRFKEAKSTGSKPKKTSKPRDYREWEKLEKEFETELNKSDDEVKDSKLKLEKMTQANKVDENVTYSKNKLFKSLPSKIDTKAGRLHQHIVWRAIFWSERLARIYNDKSCIF